MSAPIQDSSLPAAATATVVAPAASAPDYEAMRQQYEDHNRIASMLVQVAELNDRVETITRKYFPGNVQFELRCDPEIDDAYYLVHVPVTGTVEEVAALQMKWTLEMREQLQESSRFYGLFVEFP